MQHTCARLRLLLSLSRAVRFSATETWISFSLACVCSSCTFRSSASCAASTACRGEGSRNQKKIPMMRFLNGNVVVQWALVKRHLEPQYLYFGLLYLLQIVYIFHTVSHWISSLIWNSFSKESGHFCMFSVVLSDVKVTACNDNDDLW